MAFYELYLFCVNLTFIFSDFVSFVMWNTHFVQLVKPFVPGVPIWGHSHKKVQLQF